jgi:hypothetical protein
MISQLIRLRLKMINLTELEKAAIIAIWEKTGALGSVVNKIRE